MTRPPTGVDQLGWISDTERIVLSRAAHTNGQSNGTQAVCSVNVRA